MKERPILFSAPMVRAILAGTKTQTRRAVKPQPERREIAQIGHMLGFKKRNGDGFWLWPNAKSLILTECPYGQPGDRLWVREAWRTSKAADELRPSQLLGGGYDPIHYEAQDDVPFHPSEFGKLRPSMFMPRWASRITLEVTGVRVERLQDISEADALAEGIVQLVDGGFGLPEGEFYHAADPRQSYFGLWEHINGPGSVEANPWLWAIEWPRLKGGAA